MILEYYNQQQFAAQIASCYKKNSLFLYPTETFYALGCAIDSPAITRIKLLKQRSDNKPLPLLCDSWQRALPWVDELSDSSLNTFKKLTRHPLSIVLDSHQQVTSRINKNNPSLAFRVCNLSPISDLVSFLQKPIISTSANISTQQAAQNFEDLNSFFFDIDDLVIIKMANSISRYNVPSTVLIFHPPNKLVLARKGAYPINELIEDLADGWEVQF